MNYATKIFALAFLAFPGTYAVVQAQVSFINANTQCALSSIHSGCPVAIVDINGDGLDDIVRLDEAHLLYIDYQLPTHLFSEDFIGDFGYNSGWAWAMCVADVDHNGFKDV